MIGQLSSIVKQRNAGKRKQQVSAIGPCNIHVNENGSLAIERTQSAVPDEGVRRSLVLDHLSSSIGETVPLPISEPIFRCWLNAIQSCRKGFLGYGAEELAVIMTVRPLRIDQLQVSNRERVCHRSLHSGSSCEIAKIWVEASLRPSFGCFFGQLSRNTHRPSRPTPTGHLVVTCVAAMQLANFTSTGLQHILAGMHTDHGAVPSHLVPHLCEHT